MEALFGLLVLFIPLALGYLWLTKRQNKRLANENSALHSANDTLKSIKEIDDEAKEIQSTNALDDRPIRERMRVKGHLRPKR